MYLQYNLSLYYLVFLLPGRNICTCFSCMIIIFLSFPGESQEMRERNKMRDILCAFFLYFTAFLLTQMRSSKLNKISFSQQHRTLILSPLFIRVETFCALVCTPRNVYYRTVMYRDILRDFSPTVSETCIGVTIYLQLFKCSQFGVSFSVCRLHL